jgi:BlaI family transcriptional regulator, penicillinase repressor
VLTTLNPPLFGDGMKKDLDSIILTRQELQIMKVIWDLGTATVKDVCRCLSQNRATVYTTILTIMGILEDKGALLHSRSGRAYIYRPILSRQQATRNQVRDVLTRFFDGNPEKMIASVLENEIKAPEQLGAVRTLIEARKENRVA